MFTLPQHRVWRTESTPPPAASTHRPPATNCRCSTDDWCSTENKKLKTKNCSSAPPQRPPPKPSLIDRVYSSPASCLANGVYPPLAVPPHRPPATNCRCSTDDWCSTENKKLKTKNCSSAPPQRPPTKTCLTDRVYSSPASCLANGVYPPLAVSPHRPPATNCRCSTDDWCSTENKKTENQKLQFRAPATPPYKSMPHRPCLLFPSIVSGERSLPPLAVPPHRPPATNCRCSTDDWCFTEN